MNLISEKAALDELHTKLGYRFIKPELLMQAFRHASYVNEQENAHLADNERLEFLGDAVLDLAISHFLMDLFENAEEGILSKYRAMIVDKAGLYEMALKLNLGEYLLLGKGEEQSRGREKPSILANTMEALIGALYLDSGFDNTKNIIGRMFSSPLKKITKKETVYDFKSSLQEYTQQTHKALPEYRLVEDFGPPHDKTFKVVLSLSGVILAEAIGKSKKEAEQNAAKEAFFCLKEDPNI